MTSRDARRTGGVILVAALYLIPAFGIWLIVVMALWAGSVGPYALLIALMAGLGGLLAALGWGMLALKPWALAACPRWAAPPPPAIVTASARRSLPRRGIVIVARFLQTIATLAVLGMVGLPQGVMFQDVTAADASGLLGLLLGVSVASFVVAYGLIRKRRWAYEASIVVFLVLLVPYTLIVIADRSLASPALFFIALFGAPLGYLFRPVIQREVLATWTGASGIAVLRRLSRRDP